MLHPRVNAYSGFAISWLFSALLAVLWPAANAPTVAHASLGDCAQPVTNGAGPSASDCLYVLQAAIGLVTCSPECICAPKGSLPIAATDALLCLATATGQSVALDCPCVPSSTTTTTLYSPADCGAFESKIGVGKLNTPYGIAVDSAGAIYVADAGESKVFKFPATGGQPTSWGGTGTANGKFGPDDPRGLAVGTNDRIYVGDTANYRVQVFNTSGGFITTWGSQCFISSGSGCIDPDGAGPLELGDGQFIEPYAIAIDSGGNVYVVDTSNYRVEVFNADGGFLRKWTIPVVSRAIAITDDDRVYISGDNRVLIFDTLGAPLGTFGSFCRLSDQAGCIDPDGSGPLESGDGQWFQSVGMIAGGSGGIFVVDDANSRVQWLGKQGAFRAKWGSACSPFDPAGCVDPDGMGPLELGDGQFGEPTGVAILPSGDVLVAEATNGRVQRFSCPDLQ